MVFATVSRFCTEQGVERRCRGKNLSVKEDLSFLDSKMSGFVPSLKASKNDFLLW